MKVIGVIGLPASGKGVVSGLAANAGVPVVVMGDVIRKKAEEKGIPLTDSNLGAIAKNFREELGMDAIAQFTLPVIKNCKSDIVLVDGIRGTAEIDLYRLNFPDFLLVAVNAPFDKRLIRLRSRGRTDDTLTDDELEVREKREAGFGLIDAIQSADIMMDNSGTLADFEKKVEDFLRMQGVSI